MSRTCAFSVSTVAIAMAATAASAQTVPPTSGQLLQQAQPQPAEPPKDAPGLTVTTPTPPASRDTTPFGVSRIVIEGSTLFSAATLHDLVASAEGRQQTLASLDALAGRVTAFYQTHGYPLDRAIVPPQTLEGGVVRLRVIEARYGQVTIDNHSRVSDRLLGDTLAPLRPGDPVEQRRLDRQLLLLDDLPGVSAHSLLKPGSQPGSSDLAVDVRALPPVSGDVTIDDAGDRYTGRIRLGANLAVTNLAGHGDRLMLSLLSSTEHMRYGRAAYDIAVNGAGMRLGGSLSALDYRVGGSLANLDAHGNAAAASGWVSQQIVRSPDSNASIRIQVDGHRLRDTIGVVSIHSDRHSWDWTATAEADHRDHWGGGGITTAQFGVTLGTLDFDDPTAKAIDAATADTQGRYVRWNGSISRLQALAAGTRLYLAASGQYSPYNLDSSEQFLLGGIQDLRGYDPSTLAGASGYLTTAELRQDLNLPAGAWQVSAFVDHGAVKVDEDRWPGQTGPNHATLTSAGIGLDWASRGWAARLQLARPIGDTPTLAGERRGTRIWFSATKGF